MDLVTGPTAFVGTDPRTPILPPSGFTRDCDIDNISFIRSTVYEHYFYLFRSVPQTRDKYGKLLGMKRSMSGWLRADWARRIVDPRQMI